MVLLVFHFLVLSALRQTLPLPVLCFVTLAYNFLFGLSKFKIYSCYQKPRTSKTKVKRSHLPEYLYMHES